MGCVKVINCNHIWRDTPLPTPKQSVDELLKSVEAAGLHGWWLQGIEYDLATELLGKGLVKLCENCQNNDHNSQAIMIV